MIHFFRNITLFFILIITFLTAQVKDQVIEYYNNHPGYEIQKVDSNIITVKHAGQPYVKHISVDNHKKAKFKKDEQFINLTTLNPEDYEHLYDRRNQKIPICGYHGIPLVIEDFNNNNKINISGMYKIINDYELAQAGILEQEDNGWFYVKALSVYEDSVTGPIAYTDLDNDGLGELNIRGAQLLKCYESVHQDSFPDSLIFEYNLWHISGAVGSENFTDMDNDNIMDIVYVGDDSLAPMGRKIFVAEYNKNENNFVKRFSLRPEDWRISGITTGDYDGDGRKEFNTGSIHGILTVFENTGENEYEMVFEDSLYTSNAYMTCATNDIDHNGQIEFFSGGSAYFDGYGGSRMHWYEADGNNHYYKKYSFFMAGTGVLGTTELYAYDVDADGKDELVFVFDVNIVILKWDDDIQQFEVFFMDYISEGYSEMQSANIYDIDSNNTPDLLLSMAIYDDEPTVFTYFFRNNFTTSINPISSTTKSFNLFNNYPNPFNGTTRISFKLHTKEIISLLIYDISGKVVNKLISNKVHEPGNHSTIWNGKNQNGKEVASGIYFYRLKLGNEFTKAKKMIYLK